MEWHLRLAVPADRDFLFEVHRQALGPYIEQTWGWDDGEQRAHFEATFDGGTWQVILVSGQPVGMIRTTETATRVYLDDIEILPDFQHQGLGSAIVSWVIREASAAGKPTALQVLRVNPARRLYERLGFDVIGEDDVHVRMLRRPDPNSVRSSAKSHPEVEQMK